VGSYYDYGGGSLGAYYDGYHSVYVPGYSYSTYVPSYVSVYQSAPVIYRYHDVYTYHDEGVSGASGDDAYGYGAPPAGTNDGGAGIDDGYYENAPDEGVDQSQPSGVFSYDPPDGVGPPLDWAGENTPLPGGGNPVDEGLRSFRSGDYDAARSAFVRTVLADERDGYAKFLYGLSNFALGDYAVTAVSWRRALRTSNAFLQRPPDVRALYDSAYALDAQTDRLFRVARERQDDRDVRFTLAYLLYASGEPAAAGELFGRLAKSDPADRLAEQLASVCVAAAEADRSSTGPSSAP